VQVVDLQRLLRYIVFICSFKNKVYTVLSMSINWDFIIQNFNLHAEKFFSILRNISNINQDSICVE